MKATTYLFLLLSILCSGCNKIKIEREIILPKEDSVFICDGSGNCSLLNAATGTQLWKIRLEGKMTTTPTYFNGLLIVNLVNVTDNNSTLLALDIADGKAKWMHELPGTYNSSPTVDKQNIFILSDVFWDGGTLFCIDAETGNLKWKKFDKDLRSVAPVVKDNLLYSVNEYGLLIFDALTGVKTKTIGNDLISKSLKNSRINSSPSFYPPRFYNNEIIFHAKKDGNLYVNSYNTMSGIKEELFKTKFFSYSYPSLLVNNGLLITTNDSYLLAYNLETRKEDWSLNSDIYISKYSTITSPDKVFVIDYSDVYAADLFSGERKWEVRYNNNIASSPLYFDDKLFISTLNSLKVLSSENGKELWDYPLNNQRSYQFHPSPLVITTTGVSIHSGVSGELQ